MRIESLLFKNFRNLSDESMTPHPSINIIHGMNGQGKTNILEAISCLSLGKSFRSVTDKTLIQFTRPLFYIEGSLVDHDVPKTLALSYNGTSKQSRVNGILQPKLIQFVGHLKTVSFEPDDLELTKGGNSPKRKFLDMLLCQVDPHYAHALAHYQKALDQRNALLKRRPTGWMQMIPAWDEHLANHAVILWRKRKEAMTFISETLPVFFSRVSETDDDVKADYRLKVSEEGVPSRKMPSEEELKRLFLENLIALREAEMRRGHTLIGPHRDDITFFLNHMDVKQYASQGQQRLFSISLKVAELHYIEKDCQTSPVLLLDDVFSELDDTKVKNLLHVLNENDRQIFITGVNPHEIPFDHASFSIKEGSIRKETLSFQ